MTTHRERAAFLATSNNRSASESRSAALEIIQRVHVEDVAREKLVFVLLVRRFEHRSVRKARRRTLGAERDDHGGARLLGDHRGLRDVVAFLRNLEAPVHVRALVLVDDEEVELPQRRDRHGCGRQMATPAAG